MKDSTHSKVFRSVVNFFILYRAYILIVYYFSNNVLYPVITIHVILINIFIDLEMSLKMKTVTDTHFPDIYLTVNNVEIMIF